MILVVFSILTTNLYLQIDKHKAKGALKEIGIAKASDVPLDIRSTSNYNIQFVVPTMACGVVDRAIQAFGAEGVSQDQPLAALYAGLRTLRLADVSPFQFIEIFHRAYHSFTF